MANDANPAIMSVVTNLLANDTCMADRVQLKSMRCDDAALLRLTFHADGGPAVPK